MQKKQYDLIVLGGGSGGIASAIRAAEHGARVAIVEPNHLGGTCVNLGCIPKKIMYHAANIAQILHKSSDYGFSPDAKPFNWSKLVNERTRYIDFLRMHYEKKLEQHHITQLNGFGAFYDQHSVKINSHTYQADHIIIATGGEPSIPPIDGINHAIDSDGFFSLNKQPLKVAIIGSGYIGVELAGILNSLGTETHLLMQGSKPLSRFDPMISDHLLKNMRQRGIYIHPNHTAKKITLQHNGRKSILCENELLLRELDVVITATGRKPRTKNLNLAKVKVKTDERGLINVDDFQNTSTKGIYAIGDVTKGPALTPVAIAAGRKLSDRLFGGNENSHLDYESICTVVFTHPPIGTVGLSETDAIKKHGETNIKVYQSHFTPLSDSICIEKTATAMKLVTLGKEEKIIGLHVIGYHADEMLQGFGVAIKMGACKKDFDNTVAIHPTSAEEFVTMT